MSRRDFCGVVASLATVGASESRAQAPAVVSGASSRPEITDGVASGDVFGRSAIIWARTNRPARMIVEFSTTESMANATRIVGAAALPESDFTAKTLLDGLPLGEHIFYRVRFQDLGSPKVVSLPATGRFRTPAGDRRDVRFAWGGDVAGQGFGIDPAHGGMLTFDSIRRAEPDFFIHSGDAIYADNPIEPELKLPGGATWKNLTTEAKSKVAESLDEFRGNYRYNLLDENVRRFNSEVCQIVQWDDHETRNNWYPGQVVDDARYKEKSIDLLAARAKRAFMEYQPIRSQAGDPERIFRSIPCGPLVEVFLLDERSYRGPNSGNRQRMESPETDFLGNQQLSWLIRRMKNSRALWKVVASDMPIGLIVGDGPGRYEAVANGENGPALGRELEVARLLRAMKEHKVHNVAWLTADVHYAAAHHYDPASARFNDFLPFWEFVAGPLHAGTFGPGRLDDTFGPTVHFKAIPDGMAPNRPPSEGRQFFGMVRVEGSTGVMTVSLHDRGGTRLYSVDLTPSA